MKSFIFSFLLVACGFICSTTATAEDSFINRDELFELALSGDVDELQRLFAETHRDVSSGRREISHLRWLNSVLIVSHPRILEVSQNWLEAYPDSVYAKALLSFQLYDTAWRMRGEGLGRETHPDAHAYFNAYRQMAFDLAYEAYQAAPGYVPASDAVISLNQTMQVFWGYEIESIIDDVMEQSPNLGTVRRAAAMHLPQWGGEGLSGVRRHCRKYIPLVYKREGLTPETCIALMTFIQPFPEPVRQQAAEQLVDAQVEEFETTLAKVVLHLQIEDRHEEVKDLLLSYEEIGSQGVELARSYAFWQGSRDAKDVLDTVIERAYATAQHGLYYDPYEPTYIEIIRSYGPLFTPNPLPLDHREKDLDLVARQVGGQPFSSQAWESLAAAVRYRDGFDASRAFQSNAIAYGLQKEDPSFGYLYQVYTNWQNKRRALGQDRLNAEEFAGLEEKMICEVVRVTRLAEALCDYDPQFYAASCDPFKMGSKRLPHMVDEVAELISYAESAPYACTAERSANLEQLMYHPVEADIEQFILDRRENGGE